MYVGIYDKDEEMGCGGGVCDGILNLGFFFGFLLKEDCGNLVVICCWGGCYYIMLYYICFVLISIRICVNVYVILWLWYI